MSPRILVPVEPNTAPDARVELVTAVAAPLGAVVELLVIVPFLGAVDPHTTLTPDDEQQAEAIAEHTRTTRAIWAGVIADWSEAGLSTEVQVASGHVAKEILRRAEAVHAAYIVMASHGRSGLSRAVMGSVTEAVLRRAKCPVLVLPRTAVLAA